jgi:hypothetical protein
MSKSTRTLGPATTADVRKFFLAEPKRLDRFKVEADRLAVERALRPGSRGNLPAVMVAEFNKGRKADRRYTRGATKAAVAKAQAEAKALRAASGTTAKRGPLPKVKPSVSTPKA